MRAGLQPSASIDGSPHGDAAHSEAGLTDPGNNERIREFIAAKVIGRWRDGTSLVRYPVRPGTQDQANEPDRPAQHAEHRAGAPDAAATAQPLCAA